MGFSFPRFPSSFFSLSNSPEFYLLTLPFRKTASFCLSFRILDGQRPPRSRCMNMDLTLCGPRLSRVESISVLPALDHSPEPLNYCCCVIKIICSEFIVVSCKRVSKIHCYYWSQNFQWIIFLKKVTTILSCPMRSVFHVA